MIYFRVPIGDSKPDSHSPKLRLRSEIEKFRSPPSPSTAGYVGFLLGAVTPRVIRLVDDELAEPVNLIVAFAFLFIVLAFAKWTDTR